MYNKITYVPEIWITLQDLYDLLEVSVVLNPEVPIGGVVVLGIGVHDGTVWVVAGLLGRPGFDQHKQQQHDRRRGKHKQGPSPHPAWLGTDQKKTPKNVIIL